MADEDFAKAFVDYFNQRYSNVPPGLEYVRSPHDITIMRDDDKVPVVKIWVKGDNMNIRNPETGESYNFNMGDPEAFNMIDLIMLRFAQEQLPDDIIDPWWPEEEQ